MQNVALLMEGPWWQGLAELQFACTPGFWFVTGKVWQVAGINYLLLLGADDTIFFAYTHHQATLSTTAQDAAVA